MSVAVSSSRAPWHSLHGHQPRVRMDLGGGGLTRFLCHQGFVGPWLWFQYRERPKCCSSGTSSTRCTSSPSADTLSQGRAVGEPRRNFLHLFCTPRPGPYPPTDPLEFPSNPPAWEAPGGQSQCPHLRPGSWGLSSCRPQHVLLKSPFPCFSLHSQKNPVATIK